VLPGLAVDARCGLPSHVLVGVVKTVDVVDMVPERSELCFPFSIGYSSYLIQRILQKIEQGELDIRFRHENLGGLQNSLDNVSNRLSFSIILASLIIGSSMIITTGVKPLIFGYPVIGLIGYLISAILGDNIGIAGYRAAMHFIYHPCCLVSGYQSDAIFRPYLFGSRQIR